jgi:DNA (cytosine-5)-methyltransferase 1
LELLKPPTLDKEVDVIVGSPPCQSFSLANRRKTNNGNGSLLYLSFARYLNFYKPKIFVLENVMGLLSYKIADGSKIIDEITKCLGINYNVKIIKVCCSQFGVPQKRKRVFIIGVRKDFMSFFPKLTPYPCVERLCDFLLSREEVPSNYFLSSKAISGILQRQKVNREKGNGFGAKYVNINSFCNTITASY